MRFKPTPGYLIVRPIKSKEMTEGGIVIPQAKNQVPQEAIIVEMGSVITSNPSIVIIPSYKVGDRIMFKKWEVIDFQPEGITGEKFLIIKHKDVLAVVEEKEVS